MAITWSGMRKKLEEGYLAPSLRGRIQYFATSYRESHDGDKGRASIWLDGEEVLKSNYFDKERQIYNEWKYTGFRAWRERISYVQDQGGFDQNNFYRAFAEFDNQGIEASLESDNSLVRLWAVLDRRLGKRRLLALADRMEQEIDYIRFFIGYGSRPRGCR